MGKTRFAYTISPSKTWEGVFGALLFPVISGFIFWSLGVLSNGFLTLKLPLYDYIFLGLITGFLALSGDLCISFLKRCANVKDCGSVLGVHGGMLDRIDSLLLLYPFIYWYALEFKAYTHSKDYDFDKVHVLNFLHLK